MSGSMTRRKVIRALGVGSLGGASVAILAACGETQVVEVEKIVEKEVPVERVVEKEVPVERVVEKVVEKEVPVEVQKVVEVEKVVTREVMVEAPVQMEPTPPIQFMNYWAAGTRWETMKAGLEEFDKQFPNVKYDLIPIPPGFYRDKVNIMFAAGTVGDVVVLNGARMREFAPGLVQLQEHVDKAGIDLDDFLILSRENPDDPSLQNLDIDGVLYGMPFMSAVNGYVYNIDKFDADGVDAPTADWTWDSQLEAARQLTNAEKNEYGLHHGTGGEFRWLPLISANGGWLFTERTRPAPASGFATEGGLEAFEWYVNATYEEGVGVPLGELSQLLTEGITAPFATGKIGMEPGGIHGPGGRKLRVGGRFEWDNMPSPRSPIGEVAYSTNELGHFITVKALEHGTVEASVILTSFIAGEYFQGLVADGRGAIPMHRSAINSDRYLGFQPGMPRSMELIRDHFLSPDAYGLMFFSGWAQWWNILHDETQPAIVGEIPAREALLNAQAACDKHLATLQ